MKKTLYLSRALETAKVVVGNNNPNIIADDGLREHNLGDFCGNICRVRWV